MRNFALIVAGLVAAGASANVIIDDFSLAYSKTITSGSWVDYQSGAFLGGSGERDIEMRVLSNPLQQQLDLTITGSQLSIVSNGFQTLSRISLQYDGFDDEAGNTGQNRLLTDSEFTGSKLAGNDKLVVKFLDNDLPVNVKAIVRNSGGIIQQISQVRAAGAGAGDMVFDFGFANLQDARSVTFVFEADRSGDFAIEGIEAVPEPATMVALGAGALALIRRRRSK